jgi:hypothetical protein
MTIFARNKGHHESLLTSIILLVPQFISILSTQLVQKDDIVSVFDYVGNIENPTKVIHYWHLCFKKFSVLIL